MNEIVTLLTDHFIEAGLVLFMGGVIYKKKRIFRSIRSYYFRRSECRVSFACLLVIQKNNRYLLTRNINRPEIFGPIGGVYKYYDSAKPVLDNLEFRQQQIDNAKVTGDLRGFIPSKNLNKFISWFNKGIDREIESATRELREELTQELKLSDNIIKKEIPRLRKLKTISEGPYPVKGREYVQYRHLDIFELLPTSEFSIELVNYLEKVSNKKRNDMEWATASEIKKGRVNDSKHLIGSYCGYLISSKRNGEEDVHYD